MGAHVRVLHRIFHLSADAWTDGANRAYNGVVLTYIDEQWLFHAKRIACLPFPLSHVQQSVYDNVVAALRRVGLQLSDMFSVCTNNGSNYAGAFESEDSVGFLACFAHTLQLVLSHAFEDSPKAGTVFKLEHTIMVFVVRLRLRREELACVQSVNAFDRLNAIMDEITRWG